MSAGNIDRMAYALDRGVPWHGIGHPFDTAVTSDAMIRETGMGFTVEKRPLFVGAASDATDRNGNPIYVPPTIDARPISDSVATVRTDTGAALGTVSPSYECWDYSESLSFLDDLIVDGTAVYEAGGTFDGGATGWVVLRLPDDVTVGADDLIRSYMLVRTGHDGATAVDIAPVNVRPICANTISMALAELPHDHPLRFTIRHTRNMRDRIGDARSALAVTTRAQRRLATFLDAAADVQATTDDYRAVIDSIFGPALELDAPDTTERKIRSRERGIAKLNRIGAEEVGRFGTTAASLFHTITGYADHAFTIRGKDDDARAINRFRAILDDGPAERAKARGIVAIRDRFPELARIGAGE